MRAFDLSSFQSRPCKRGVDLDDATAVLADMPEVFRDFI